MFLFIVHLQVFISIDFTKFPSPDWITLDKEASKKTPGHSMHDSEFVDDSILDILVPQASEYDVAEIISSRGVHDDGESDTARFFSFISQRSILHFGKIDLDAHANH